MIRALFVTSLTFAYVLLLGPPVLLYALLSGETDPIYRVGVWGCKLVLWLAGVRLQVRGLEKIPTARAVVFMANHQSNADPPALIATLPSVLVLVRKEIFRLPVVGRAMRMRGFVSVDRQNRERAILAIEEAIESLKAGRSFLAYPEGTRSRDGQLLPFKKGVFMMAIQAQVPVVPITVSGFTKIMRKGERVLHPGVARITIHDAVPTDGFSTEDREAIMERVRQAIFSGLADDEKSPEGSPAAEGADAEHWKASGGRHEVALRHGFARADVDGEIVLYEHLELGALHTFSDGSWKHVARDGSETSGEGSGELEEQLARSERKLRRAPS
ncbi:MAG: 1-acyl-sn-glycerol-3-phosphate acyltransferase [Acidobacteriia bacterium]|nr:1-acyl-sn-glycerol-3-phosphate acyltransferase [Terriglobia bacterium]